MIRSRKIFVFVAGMLLLSGLAAQYAPAPAVEKVVIKPVEVTPENPDANRVRLDTVISMEPTTLDPALSTDNVSIFFARQMFVSLTDFDEKANVVPALATEWQVSADGLTWTYKLRDDIQWVQRDSASGKIEAVGPVTAQDVVYGTLRTLNPNTASGYAYVLYVIQGAEEFNTAKPDDENFDQLEAAVGVKALDDKTVQFTLKAPAAYFPSITALWVTCPQPQATIEKYGSNWTEAGLIVTNGPYTLREWQHDAALMLEKNPLWINARDVQIELFGGPIVQEASTAMAMYEHNQIDLISDSPGVGVPLSEIERIKSDPQLSKELYIAPKPCTYYYGFVDTKPPFDNVNVRKAFAMAIDRQDLIDNVLKGGQLPAHSFTSPGNFGSVADDKDIGAFLIKASYGDQVKEARKLLADAGYPEGQGLDLMLMHNTEETQAQIAQAIQAMWAEAFPKAKVTIEHREWEVYLQRLLPDAPDADKPDIFYMGWCADYPDANNWLNEVFNSKSGQNYARYNNPAFDKLVEQAAFEPDPARRQELYRQAEDIFINKDVAIAPIYYFTYVRLYKPWLTRVVVSPLVEDPIAEWRIDWAAKMNARDLAPAAEANPAAISTVQELVGQWWRPAIGPKGERYGWLIKEDGTFEVIMEQKVADRVVALPVDSGKLWFEGTELHVQSSSGGDDGIYTVERTADDQLKFVAVGKDPDPDRQTVITDDLWHK